MADYSQEQIYEAMRRADAAGDADAVKALAKALKEGASKQQILDVAKQKNVSVDENALDANIRSRDAGGPTNTFVPPDRSIASDLATGTQNAVVGAAQGVASATYDPLATASNYVQRGTTAALGYLGEGALNMAGLDNAADFWRRGTDRRMADLQADPTVSGALERLSPAPEGMGGARVAAQLVGALAVPFPKAGAPVRAPALAPTSAASKVIEAGDREGVRVMTTDVVPPKRFLGKFARATGERIPYAGTGGQRAAQQTERISAVKNLANEYGVGTVEDVAADLAKTRGDKIAKLKTAKDSVIDGIPGAVDAPNAVAEIDRQIARLEGINKDAMAPVVSKLKNFREVLTSGKSLREVEENRRLLGDLFQDQSLASIKSTGQDALNKIYDPLRSDMGNFIKSKAGDASFSKWKGANDELSAMAGELKAAKFKSVLGKTETTPEAAGELLFNTKASEVRRLYANLSQTGREKAKAAVIQEAVKRAGGIEELSPQNFAKALEKFGDNVGIVFGKDAPRIQGLVRLLKATQQASVAAAAPPTGVQNAPVVGAAVLADWLGSAGGAIASAAMAGLAARAYESAPVRNLLVRLSEAKPGSPNENKLLDRIGKLIVSQGEIRGVANDNAALTTNVAAQPNNQQ